MNANARPAFRARLAVVAVVVALGAAVPNPDRAVGLTAPAAIDLGTLPGGYFGDARYISGKMVAGDVETDDGRHAFAYDFGAASPTMRDLGTLGGDVAVTGVSSNAVVGWGRFEIDGRFPQHAFAYDLGAGSTIDLGTLGGDGSYAYAVSGNVVVGGATTPERAHHAFAYDLAGAQSMRDLGTLGGGNPPTTLEHSEARAIDGNVVVGRSLSPEGMHAFAYDLGSASPMIDLGVLPGTSESRAIAVSGNIVVGESSISGIDSSRRAFAYDLGAPSPSMINLGTLAGTSASLAVAVSGNIVVGLSYTPGVAGFRSFAYDLGAASPSMIDLGTLGGTDTRVAAISGTVAVGYSTTADGAQRAFAYDLGAASQTMIELGTLGGSYSGASGISGNIVVGWAYLPGDLIGHAAAWILGEPTSTQPVAKIRDVLPLDWNGPYQLSFDGSASFDTDGSISSWEWDFGDGSVGTGEVATHSFSQPGTYSVTLVVTDDDGLSNATTATVAFVGEPVVDFAPAIRLHPQEEHFPMHPANFIANSELKWARGDCAHSTIDESPDAGRLGTRSKATGYAAKESGEGPRCRQAGPAYYGWELTRPWADGRPKNLDLDEGFYLDFKTPAEPPPFEQVPLWTQETAAGSELVITYWLFYGQSIPRFGGVGLVPFSHEGDWEHVNVRLDAVTLVPRRVGYFAHHEPELMRAYAEQVRRHEYLHPVAYSALTGHGSGPNPGVVRACGDFFGEFVCLDDEYEDDGQEWRAWELNDGIVPVQQMPGFDFGGAWGAAGIFPDTTGPLGPGRWKNPLSPG